MNGSIYEITELMKNEDFVLELEDDFIENLTRTDYKLDEKQAGENVGFIWIWLHFELPTNLFIHSFSPSYPGRGRQRQAPGEVKQALRDFQGSNEQPVQQAQEQSVWSDQESRRADLVQKSSLIRVFLGFQFGGSFLEQPKPDVLQVRSVLFNKNRFLYYKITSGLLIYTRFVDRTTWKASDLAGLFSSLAKEGRFSVFLET